MKRRVLKIYAVGVKLQFLSGSLNDVLECNKQCDTTQSAGVLLCKELGVLRL